MIESKPTPFGAIGEHTLNRLVDTFYGLVAQHPDLAPIFPNSFHESGEEKWAAINTQDQNNIAMAMIKNQLNYTCSSIHCARSAGR